ncbi:MAG TPA: transporter substrate-binding domain-containing protein [Burkholderiaceae bacterium]|nr:transporter substrate-binding domain-containing protein [Burkholderiaceae bacterium]
MRASTTLLAPALLALSSLALAQTPTTLDKVKANGSISVAYRESSIPFSYLGADGHPVGFGWEVCGKIVEQVKKATGRADLKVTTQAVTSQNRIPLLQNGSVDLECGSTTHNQERARQVSFSVSIFVTSSRLITRKGSGVMSLADLGGRRVLVTAGTTSERQLMLHMQSSGLRTDILRAKDHGEGFAMLQAGRADAFLMDEAVLYGLRAKSDKPDDWLVVGEPMPNEVYACMLRKDDAAFKAAVDRGLTALMQSGEALKIYRRWFQSPIPPKGLNLNWPPPQGLLELYRAPSDRPLG